MDTWNDILTNTLSDKKSNLFHRFSKSDKKIYSFKRKNFLEMLLGTRRMDNSVKENLTKDRKCFAQCPKKVNKRFVQKQLLLLRMIIWSSWWRFLQPCRTSPNKRRVIFAHCPKWITKIFLRKKFNLKSSNRSIQHSFQDPIGNFWTESQKRFCQYPQMMKKTYFEGKINPEIFQLTRRKQFWQSCLTFLARWLQISASGSKIDEEHFFHKQMFLRNMFLLTRSRTQLRQLCQTKVREFFGRRPKMTKKTLFRGKILHKISIWTRENSVESPAEGFLPEVGKVYPRCPKGLRKHFYQNQIFLQKCSYVNVDCPNDRPVEVLN